MVHSDRSVSQLSFLLSDDTGLYQVGKIQSGQSLTKGEVESHDGEVTRKSVPSWL